jgi:SAM-dependent methyltransferase
MANGDEAERVAALRAQADPAPARVIYVLSALRVCDHLARRPLSTAELAEQVGAEEEALGRILRVAAGMDLVVQDKDTGWSLSSTGELLASDHPSSVRAEFADNDLFTVWTEILHSVRTGEPCYAEVFGANLFDRLAERPERLRAFHEHMYERARSVYGPLLELDVWPSSGTVVDVGGGTGGLLAELLSAKPRLHGVLHDFESVLAESPLHGDDTITGRVSFIAGDVTRTPPPSGDVLVLGSVLHDFPDSTAQVILQNCRVAMGSAGRLVILDRVLPEQGFHPAMCNDLLMLVAVGGRERTLADWNRLLAGCGIDLTEVHAAQGTELSFLECRASG